MQTPQNIRVIKEERLIELVWEDSQVSRLPFRSVRLACRCAACVDEFTGRKILDPATVDEAIAPEDVSLTGNYALKIKWTDSHDTGLFTWDHLRSLSAELNQTASDD